MTKTKAVEILTQAAREGRLRFGMWAGRPRGCGCPLFHLMQALDPKRCDDDPEGFAVETFGRDTERFVDQYDSAVRYRLLSGPMMTTKEEQDLCLEKALRYLPLLELPE